MNKSCGPSDPFVGIYLIPYNDEKEIDDTVNSIIEEIHSQADWRNFFVDLCQIKEIEGKRFWD